MKQVKISPGKKPERAHAYEVNCSLLVSDLQDNVIGEITIKINQHRIVNESGKADTYETGLIGMNRAVISFTGDPISSKALDKVLYRNSMVWNEQDKNKKLEIRSK